MQITEGLYLAHCQCAYKGFLKSTGEVGKVLDYEVIETESDARFRDQAIDRLLRIRAESEVLREPPSLGSAVQDGIRLILGARVEALGVAHRFDLLERQVDRDVSRRAVYVPILFSHRNKLTREDSRRAAFLGVVLAEALGQPVPSVKVVHGPDFSVTKIKLIGPTGPTRLVKETRQILERLKRQVESTSPPLMILNSHCPACEFKHRCRAEAVSKDDLSLMRGMSEKEILAQRKHGIYSVTQFACTFRPKSIGLKRSKPLKRHLHALQALAVRDKKVYVVRNPEIPAKTTRVYLDVEGMSDRDFHYLIGVVVETDGQTSAHSFWADDEVEEQAIWIKLLDLLGALGDCTLFHFGRYEKDYIKKMLRKYPSADTPLPGAWDSTLFNVLGAIRTNVYFPTYSNSLKDIGAFLGMTWTGMVTSGIECIAARLRWEESKDSLIKEEIIAYNRRDCLAVQQVTQFLSSFGSPEGTATSRVQLASEIAVESHGRFGKVDFAIPEMSFINKCARFDYQRDKVLRA
jgi:predicted RecB family nuclease